jgi:hypothetical protein
MCWVSANTCDRFRPHQAAPLDSTDTQRQYLGDIHVHFLALWLRDKAATRLLRWGLLGIVVFIVARLAMSKLTTRVVYRKAKMLPVVCTKSVDVVDSSQNEGVPEIVAVSPRFFTARINRYWGQVVGGNGLWPRFVRSYASLLRCSHSKKVDLGTSELRVRCHQKTPSR